MVYGDNDGYRFFLLFVFFSLFSFFFLNAACPLLEGYYRCGYIFSLSFVNIEGGGRIFVYSTLFPVPTFSILATIRLLSYLWRGSFFPALYIICRVGVAIYMYFYPSILFFFLFCFLVDV